MKLRVEQDDQSSSSFQYTNKKIKKGVIYPDPIHGCRVNIMYKINGTATNGSTISTSPKVGPSARAVFRLSEVR